MLCALQNSDEQFSFKGKELIVLITLGLWNIFCERFSSEDGVLFNIETQSEK